MSDNDNPQDATKDFVPLDNIDQFAFAITDWHKTQTDLLEHMQEIPEGTKMSMQNLEGETKEILMEGQFLEGFKSGLQTALMIMGELPFVISQDDEGESEGDTDVEQSTNTTQH